MSLRKSPFRSLAALGLSVSLVGGAAQAQNTLNVQLQKVPLQPVTVGQLQLNVLRVNPALFQQTLSSPDTLKLNLSDLPARIQARDARVVAGLNLARTLTTVPDLRADVAKLILNLPEGLDIPHTVQLRDGTQKNVLLLGRDTVALSIADALQKAPENRAEVLKSLGVSLEKPLLPGLQPLNINPNLIRQIPKLNLPQPSQPGKEIGDGGNPHPTDGACRFTPANPYFSQMKGLPIDQITTIKDQANRGTCMAFAYVSALESLIAEKSHKAVNLSEQFAYYWLRGDDGILGDGAGFGDYDDAIGSHRLIPGENRWQYNPSWSRVTLPGTPGKPVTQYKNSCTNYSTGQACSDTTAQAQLVCEGGSSNCAWKPESNTISTYSFRPTQGQDIWNSLATMPFVNQDVTRAYRRYAMRQMIDQGDQLIQLFGVDGAFDHNTQGVADVSRLGQNYRGGHGVHIVGYVNTGTKTFNNVQYKVGPVTVNLGNLTFPTGLWVIKNSWSCGFGDGGYAYLPDAFMDYEVWGIYKLTKNAVVGDMPGM